MAISVVVGQREEVLRCFITVMFLAETIGIFTIGLYVLMTRSCRQWSWVCREWLFAIDQVY
jgi:hypothetical protein